MYMRTCLIIFSACLTALLFEANSSGWTGPRMRRTSIMPAALIHAYTFNAGNFNDSVGSSNGTLNGTASISGNALQLPGGSNGTAYGTLPTAVMAGLTSASFEGWFTETAIASWEKLFFPGSLDTTSFVGLTTSAGSSLNARLDFIVPGITQKTTSTIAITTGTKFYFAIVCNASKDLQTLYLAPAGGSLGTAMSTSMGGKDLSSVNFLQFYIGRSPFGGDQDFNGSLDEFRIYSGVLTPGQIAADFAAGPL